MSHAATCLSLPYLVDWILIPLGHARPLLVESRGCDDVMSLRRLPASDVMTPDRVTVTTTTVLGLVWILVAEFLSGKLISSCLLNKLKVSK